MAINTCFCQHQEIEEQRELRATQGDDYDPNLMSSEEDLNYYFRHNINLNKNSEILVELGLVSSIQLNELQNHIDRCGELLSIYELQSLRYWKLEDIRRVLPYVKVEFNFNHRNLSISEMLKFSKKDLFLRTRRSLETKSGYKRDLDGNTKYAGSPWQSYLRYRMKYNSNFSVGFTLEKDAGENILNNGRPDFLSAHCYLGNRGRLNALVIGDYSLILGQGLIHSTGFSSGKSLQITSVKQRGKGIKPYTSVNESSFLRGGALALDFNKVKFTGFASYKGLDAKLSANNDTILSLPIHGFHRTNAEKETISNAKESLLGVQVATAIKGMELAGQYVLQQYNLPYYKSMNYYNGNQFRGKVQQNTSLSYDYNFRNLNAFGEVAMDLKSSSFAHVNGLLFALNKSTSLSTLYRDYSPRYNSFYGAGFSEATRIQNERGFYASLDYKEGRHGLKIMTDIFRFPWLRYKVKAPSKGREFMTHYQFNRLKKDFIYLRFRYREKEESLSVDKHFTELVSKIQMNARVHVQIQLHPSWSWRSRLEFSKVKLGVKEFNGSMWYQDLIFRSKHIPLDISLRYALFDTQGYDARIYAYENNVLYTFSIPAYFYKGSRVYAVFRWKLHKKIDVWMKIAQSTFTNRETISQGNEKIQGNKKTDLTLQLRLKL